MTRVFGLTGGIASGKSSVARELRALGVEVIDADVLAREAVEKDSPALTAISERFGEDMLTPNGELDRTRLGRLVFSDPAALKDLNAIVHPQVATRLAARLRDLEARGCPLACYEVPLLFENGLEKSLRPVVLVAASEDQQLARAMARDGLSREQALARIRAQMPLAEKIAKADIVIKNDADLATLKTRTRDALAQVRALLARGDG